MCGVGVEWRRRRYNVGIVPPKEVFERIHRLDVFPGGARALLFKEVFERISVSASSYASTDKSAIM